MASDRFIAAGWNMVTRAQMQEERQDHVLILHISGRLDSLSSQEIEQNIAKLIAQGETRILLDFTGVDYLSSAGMRMILATYKKVQGVLGQMALCSVGDGVMDILRMSGFDALLHVYSTKEEAIRLFY